MRTTAPLLSRAQERAFARDGVLVVRALLGADEIDAIGRALRADHLLRASMQTYASSDSHPARLALMNEAGDDLCGRIARSRRVVERMEALLGGEVYLWHAKLIAKDPRTGGAWQWHQDYGYWYRYNHCLYPLLASCSIAIDRATRANGCLQVLRGSHAMGRIDHGLDGQQMGADPERLAQAMRRHELVHVEAEPGDAVFFHCNLLHGSAPNASDQPRWSYICCYNAARNDPFRDSNHPRYTPLAKVADHAVLAGIPSDDAHASPASAPAPRRARAARAAR
jgi:ectoine hydroxylase